MQALVRVLSASGKSSIGESVHVVVLVVGGLSPEEKCQLAADPTGGGLCYWDRASGASLAWWEVNLWPSCIREHPFDFSPPTPVQSLKLGWLSLSESLLPEDASQKALIQTEHWWGGGEVGWTQQELGCH